MFIEQVPIRRINFVTPSNKRTLYLDESKQLYNKYVLNDNNQRILNFVAYHLTQKPEQSDVVHDLLAFLAEETLRLNREKRAEQKRFLEELERTIRLRPDKDGRNGVDTLKDKQKIMEYPGDYQKQDSQHLSPDELLTSLYKNKGRFGVGLDAVADQIMEEYEQSLGVVLPLKEQLRKADALIDEIVYRLYGLTDEEIRVVKGE